MSRLKAEWKRGTIYLCVVCMETCWLSAWIFLVQPGLAGSPAGLVAAVFCVLLFGMLLVRILDYLGLEMKGLQMVMVPAGLILALLFVRIRYYSAYGFGNLGWIGEFLGAIWDIFSRIPAPIASFALILVLWWRSIAIGSREATHHGVLYSFRVGVVLLMVNGLAAAFLKGSGALTILAFAYFFFSLLAIGLSRIDDLEQQPEGAVSPFGTYWLSTTVAGTALVLVLAGVVSAIVSPRNAAALGRLLSPVGKAADWAIGGLFRFLVALIGPPLEAVFRWLLSLLRPFIEQVKNQPVQQIAVPTPMPVEPQGGPPAYLAIIKVVGIVLIVLFVIGLLMLSVDRYKKRRRQPGRLSEHQMDWQQPSPGDVLKARLRQGLDRLGELVDMARRFGTGRRFRAAVNIRWIYANLTRMAADAGFPRIPTQTPWEYVPALAQAFPGDESDIRVITDAYVRTHYGEAPTLPEQLDRIRDAWQRIRAHENTRGRVAPAEDAE